MTTMNLLERWLREEAEVQARLDAGPGPGVARPDQIAGKTGLEVMQAMLAGEIPHAEIARTLDFALVEVGPGLAVFQGAPLQRHLNTTAELGVNMVRALTPKVPRVRAEGRVIHGGRQLATAEARLVGPDGTLYAHATTTCLVFELPGR